MTDRRDIQRARRYIVASGMTLEQFRTKFNPQFVRNNQSKLEKDFVVLVPKAPEVVPKGESKLTKRVVFRHHYYIYDIKSKRRIGRWTWKRKR